MKKKKALLTYTRNEKIYLPIWLHHHLKSFLKEDIYVLDNETVDGSVQLAIQKNLLVKENVTLISCREAFTNQWLNDQASSMQHKLLEEYEWVILAEVDELIAINPDKFSGWEELLHHLEKDSRQVFRALGYDVVHDYEKELPIDLNKPILSQRENARVWRPELNNGKMLFSKPILTRSPVRWRAGGHDIVSPNDPKRTPLDAKIEEGILLFHLNMFDYELCEKRRSDRVQPGQQKIGGDRLTVGKQLLQEMKSYLTHPATMKISEKYQNLV